MLNNNQKFGANSESIAAKYLAETLGYKILEKNFRTKTGEIDIIAKDGDTLVFVEVKARRSASYGNPKYAVTFRKQKKISMAALYYLKTRKLINAKARFDVAAITFSQELPEIEIIKNAFELACR